ncbi:MAG: hypothetical protein ACPG8F_03240 [Flavobacteriaceae bacterium]
MAFQLFMLQLFFLLMAGLILYLNRNMLGKTSSFSFFFRAKKTL